MPHRASFLHERLSAKQFSKIDSHILPEMVLPCSQEVAPQTDFNIYRLYLSEKQVMNTHVVWFFLALTFLCSLRMLQINIIVLPSAERRPNPAWDSTNRHEPKGGPLFWAAFYPVVQRRLIINTLNILVFEIWNQSWVLFEHLHGLIKF